MFSDYDAGLAKFPVDIYSPAEFNSILEDYRKRKVLPTSDELDESQIFSLAGRVPRLLAKLKQIYVENNHMWSGNLYLRLKKDNLDYFAFRVKVVLLRNSANDILEFACRVCINSYQSSGHAPSIWIVSGLFENSEGRGALPIAPDVIDAMYEVCSTEIDIIVRSLAKTDARGIAFQMFVQMGLDKVSSFKFPVARLDPDTSGCG